MPGSAEDDDLPRSRRRHRDDDSPVKQGPSVLLILGIVLGGLVLVCAGGAAAVVFGVVLPAAQKVREKQAEMVAAEQQAKQVAERAEVAAQLPQNPRLTAGNVARVREGMTLAQVEELFGTGSPSSVSLVTRVTDARPDPQEVRVRWLGEHKLARVYHWQHRDDHCLVAFSDRTASGQIVRGVLTLMGGESAEPTPLAAPPPPAVTVEQLTAKFGDYDGKVVVLRGRYLQPAKDPVGAIELHSGPGTTATVQSTTPITWEPPPVPLERMEFRGTVEGTPRLITLRGATLLTRRPPGEGVVSVASTDLASEFDADPDAATKKYQGKTVRVYGTVTMAGGGGIQLGLKGLFVTKPKVSSVHIVGRFEGGNRGPANAVPFKSEAVIVGRFAECKKGDKSATVYLNDCTVEK